MCGSVPNIGTASSQPSATTPRRAVCRALTARSSPCRRAVVGLTGRLVPVTGERACNLDVASIIRVYRESDLASSRTPARLTGDTGNAPCRASNTRSCWAIKCAVNARAHIDSVATKDGSIVDFAICFGKRAPSGYARGSRVRIRPRYAIDIETTSATDYIVDGHADWRIRCRHVSCGVPSYGDE